MYLAVLESYQDSEDLSAMTRDRQGNQRGDPRIWDCFFQRDAY